MHSLGRFKHYIYQKMPQFSAQVVPSLRVAWLCFSGQLIPTVFIIIFVIGRLKIYVTFNLPDLEFYTLWGWNCCDLAEYQIILPLSLSVLSVRSYSWSEDGGPRWPINHLSPAFFWSGFQHKLVPLPHSDRLARSSFWLQSSCCRLNRKASRWKVFIMILLVILSNSTSFTIVSASSSQEDMANFKKREIIGTIFGQILYNDIL